MKIDWNRKYTTISAYAIVVFLICFMIYRLTNNWVETKVLLDKAMAISAPFFIGMMIAYFINPLVNRIEYKFFSWIKIGRSPEKQARFRHNLSITVSYIIVLSAITLLLAIIIPQVIGNFYEIVQDLPLYLQNFMTYLKDLSLKIGSTTYVIDVEQVNGFINDALTSSTSIVPDMMGGIIPNIFNFTMNFTVGALQILVSIIISIYLIGNKDASLRYMKKVTEALFMKKRATSIMETAAFSHHIFTSFFIGKVIDSIIIGILTFIILVIAKMPFALLLSVVVGITNVIPYFGPFIGGGIGFLFLLLIDPVKALWFLLIILIIQQFDGNILGPHILGGSVGISPFWIIFSVMVFGSLFGFIGMFLGVPFFKVLMSLFDRYVEAQRAKKIEAELSPGDLGTD